MNKGNGQLMNYLNFLMSRGTIIIMLATFIVLGLRARLFFATGNLMDILMQGGILTLVAISLNLVLIPGGFDMSAGAASNLSCNIVAGLILAGVNPMLTIPVGLIIGLIIGISNSFLVVFMRIPPFVATLGSMYVIQGLTALYNKGEALAIKPQPIFTDLGRGAILGIPNLFIILICVCIAVHYFLKHTATGLRMYASGGNSAAAELRGVNTKKYLIIGFCLSGLLLGFAGVLQASYAYGASAVNTSFEFFVKALTAAYLGSTFSKTGELSVIGTVISGTFIAGLNNGLIINGVSDQQIAGILGLILILSILITVVRKREIGQVTIF